MDKNDTQAGSFAKTFLDLWQEQLNQSLTDPAALSAMMAIWRQLQEAAARAPQHSPAAWGGPHDPFTAQPAYSPNHSAYAAAPHAGYGMLVELAGRLAACEARLAVVEQALATKDSAPAGRAGGRRKRKPSQSAK